VELEEPEAVVVVQVEHLLERPERAEQELFLFTIKNVLRNW
jgi:hypothetical protein